MSSSPKKAAAKAKKAKAPANHPKYADMVKAAITALKERNGSSRQAILKYIMAHYKVGNDQKPVNSRIKVALRAGVKKGSLKHVGKSVGAQGSFRVAEKAAKAKKAKSPKKTAAKKPKAKKTPKKAAKPKTEAKKATPKKAAKKAAPKKAAAKPKPAVKAKSPAKKVKAAKPKAAKKAKKSPKKAAAKK